jgi:hypothetical protein
MCVDDARDFKDLRTEGGKLDRLVSDAELDRMMPREIAKRKL